MRELWSKLRAWWGSEYQVWSDGFDDGFDRGWDGGLKAGRDAASELVTDIWEEMWQPGAVGQPETEAEREALRVRVCEFMGWKS